MCYVCVLCVCVCACVMCVHVSVCVCVHTSVEVVSGEHAGWRVDAGHGGSGWVC